MGCGPSASNNLSPTNPNAKSLAVGPGEALRRPSTPSTLSSIADHPPGAVRSSLAGPPEPSPHEQTQLAIDSPDSSLMKQSGSEDERRHSQEAPKSSRSGGPASQDASGSEISGDVPLPQAIHVSVVKSLQDVAWLIPVVVATKALVAAVACQVTKNPVVSLIESCKDWTFWPVLTMPQISPDDEYDEESIRVHSSTEPCFIPPERCSDVYFLREDCGLAHGFWQLRGPRKVPVASPIKAYLSEDCDVIVALHVDNPPCAPSFKRCMIAGSYSRLMACSSGRTKRTSFLRLYHAELQKGHRTVEFTDPLGTGYNLVTVFVRGKSMDETFGPLEVTPVEEEYVFPERHPIWLIPMNPANASPKRLSLTRQDSPIPYIPPKSSLLRKNLSDLSSSSNGSQDKRINDEENTSGPPGGLAISAKPHEEQPHIPTPPSGSPSRPPSESRNLLLEHKPPSLSMNLVFGNYPPHGRDRSEGSRTPSSSPGSRKDWTTSGSLPMIDSRSPHSPDNPPLTSKTEAPAEDLFSKAMGLPSLQRKASSRSKKSPP
eukprot:Sspe_Gene.77191::Locus_48220_Transcript_1_1_Confidence_1.000_Length_1907::g.77191::m.77191